MVPPAMTKVTVRRRAAALLSAVLLLGAAACRKGESQGDGGGNEGGYGGEGGEGGYGGEGGGAPACGTCASVFTNGGVTCGGTSSSDAYDALYACGCGACSAACAGTLCMSAPPDGTCGKCLETSCAAQAKECAAN